jgi:hypothetical protein
MTASPVRELPFTRIKLPNQTRKLPRKWAWVLRFRSKSPSSFGCSSKCSVRYRFEKVVGAKGFEPSTSWSRTESLNPINALSGVAYGKRSLISPLLVVRSLYAT